MYNEISRQTISMKTKNQTRYGVFYVSNGRWVGPYKGVTFTNYTMTRNPFKQDFSILKNRVLKSEAVIRPATWLK